MAKTTVKNILGEKTSEIELNPVIFGVKLNEALVHRAVVAQAANARNTVAKTKDRSEVSGGGIKPWKQKGTGRARHGSIRSPLWRGGGITFGPTPERNFQKKINKKEKNKALFMVLSSKVLNNRLVVIEDLKLKKIKTQDLVKILKKLSLLSKKILIVLAKTDKILFKSAANIPGVKMTLSSTLNVIDLLTYDFLLMTNESARMIEKNYLK
jgi:large subunit ribosomal protein L4